MFVQGRIGAANAAEFFGVLRELQAGADVTRLLAAEPGEATARLLPRSLDGLYAMVYGLLAAVSGEPALRRAFQIVEQYPDMRGEAPLPVREAQTLSMELLFARGIELGLETVILADPVYQRYAEGRERDGFAA